MPWYDCLLQCQHSKHSETLFKQYPAYINPCLVGDMSTRHSPQLFYFLVKNINMEQKLGSITTEVFYVTCHRLICKELQLSLAGGIVMAYFYCWTSDSDSDSDTDSCTVQILWERDPNLNLSQWKHVLHNTM